MCRDCGCEEGNARAYFHDHEHDHSHRHDRGSLHPHGSEAHSHAHGHTVFQGSELHLPAGGEGVQIHIHHHYYGADQGAAAPRATGERRRVEVESAVLAKNDAVAAENRAWLAEHGVQTINLISSPGSGKTLLLEKTLEALAGEMPCGVIVGDQQTDNDARRLDHPGVRVRQIETRSACHLGAEQVARHLGEVVGDGLRLLFIENVGNLVCPAAFDLGELHKIALLSVTEGEDKPVKYPLLFHDAPVVVITKTDLVPHLDWDREACLASIRTVRPDARIIELSARSGNGMGEWFDYLRSL